MHHPAVIVMPDSALELESLAYLGQDRLLHMDMIEPIRRKSAEILFAGTDGVLILEKNSKTFMMSVDSPAAGETLIGSLAAGETINGSPAAGETINGSLPAAELFVVHQAFCIPFVSQKYGFTRVMDCIQAVYPSKQLIPLKAGIEIKCLDLNWAGFVRAHYQTVDDEGYIRELLGKGLIYGAFADGEPAGFIGMHDEGSIGLLVVLPQFRRRGIGTALESYLVNWMLEKGWTPFGQIQSGNTESVLLQKHLGFEISSQHLYWLSHTS